MAHRETIQNENVSGWVGSNFFYANSASVGYGCPNKPDDVRLIQFFINRFFGRPLLVIDGSYGGQTWNAIKQFQQMGGLNGAGMVSKADGRRWLSPKSGKPYTIYDLNQCYNMYHPEFWRNPRLDPWFPKELASHLWGPLPQLV